MENEDSDEKETEQNVINNFERKYIMREFIGKGHFGEVYKVQDKLTQKTFAVKVTHF